jgi:hypothetical protein
MLIARKRSTQSLGEGSTPTSHSTTASEGSRRACDSVDRERADFIHKYFNVEWPDRAICHSMINTAIGDEGVVHMILDLKETYQARATA